MARSNFYLWGTILWNRCWVFLFFQPVTLADARICQMPPLLTRRCLCLSLLVQLFSAWVLVCSELQSGSRPFIQNQMRVWQRLHLRHFSARQLRLGKSSPVSSSTSFLSDIRDREFARVHRAVVVLARSASRSPRISSSNIPSFYFPIFLFTTPSCAEIAVH